jgi:hypothetical protein
MSNINYDSTVKYAEKRINAALESGSISRADAKRLYDNTRTSCANRNYERGINADKNNIPFERAVKVDNLDRPEKRLDK